MEYDFYNWNLQPQQEMEVQEQPQFDPVEAQLQRVAMMRKCIFYNAKAEASEAEYKEIDAPWGGLHETINKVEDASFGRQCRRL